MKEQLISICGNKCTDCKACSSVCPIHCIMDKINDDGRTELAIDTKKCIGCNKCKKVIEVQDDLLEELEERIRNTYGFDILDHSVKFFGICSECKNKEEK